MSGADTQRIDKWLWAVRFYKTRSQAAAAVSGGKVHINNVRVKPSREIKPGDELSITRDMYVWRIKVDGLAKRRGPAGEAAMLYTEYEDSARDREALIEQQKLERAGKYGLQNRPEKRPDKRGRRNIIRFTRRER
jgi:ribosome-associated heat shock protein Hsp15